VRPPPGTQASGSEEWGPTTQETGWELASSPLPPILAVRQPI